MKDVRRLVGPSGRERRYQSPVAARGCCAGICPSRAQIAAITLLADPTTIITQGTTYDNAGFCAKLNVSQPSLFDDRDMAEITSHDYPSERLVVCKNPLLAEERARKRAELLATLRATPASQ